MSDAIWRSIESSIADRHDWFVGFRRELHAAPEPSAQERDTTRLIAAELAEAGYEPRVLADEIGVVADLDLGADTGSIIALRSELDCVQVPDEKAVPYASRRPGLCHACGHDAHSTILLGTALSLAEHRDALMDAGFQHNLRLIFQPAEETATGATSVIEQGGIDGVTAILALHVDPYRTVGQIGVRSGPMTAACKIFRIMARGRSGHSARPHEAIDPIPALTNVVSLLYQLGPRSMDSRFPLALSVSSITSGSAYNAIPETATLRGTLRAVRASDMEDVEHRMHAVVEGVARCTGCDVQLEFVHDAPETRNDPALVPLVEEAGRAVLGYDSVQWIDVPSLGGEDFAFYQQQVPGVFVRLGAALNDGRPAQPLHSALFDINEAALDVGARFMSRTALHLAATLEPDGRA